MAYIPQSGSVIAFQNPASIEAVSVAGGNINVNNFPTNQSISGTITASVTGRVPVGLYTASGTVLNDSGGNLVVNVGNFATGSFGNSDAVSSALSTALSFSENFIWDDTAGVWERSRGNASIGTLISTGASSVITINKSSVAVAIVSGSIAATFTPPANQSVSGTVHVDNIGSIIAYQAAGSVLAVSGSFTTGNSSVQVLNFPTTQNVSGSVAAFQQGTWNVSITGTISAGNSSVQVLNFPTNQNVSGSVVSFQGTNPWVVTGSVQATVSTGNSSVQVLNFPTTQSITGQINGINAPKASITGNPIYIGGKDQNGSIVGATFGINNELVTIGSVQGTMSVLGTVPVTQSGTWYSSVLIASVVGAIPVSGSFSATVSSASVVQQGTWNVSIVSTVPSSVIVGASIFGQLPAGTAMIGSVVAYQGVIPWTIGSVYGNISGSVAATITNTNVNVSGSVVAWQGTSSWVTKPFVTEDASVFRYTGSVTSTSVTVIAASVASKKFYITDFWVANTGSVATLVTWKDGSTSILGQTIAPGGGGSNAPGIAIPIPTTASAQDLTFAASTAVSVLYVQVNGYKA